MVPPPLPSPQRRRQDVGAIGIKAPATKPSSIIKEPNMASSQIVAVRTEDSETGSHEHISRVKLRYGAELPRSIVVNDIRSGNDSYYTEADGSRAQVVVVDCPYCIHFHDYIKTRADSTTADNLLSLPRF
jgi:Protein of unknown function (DUF3892)